MPLDNYITLSQLTKSVKGLVNKINGEATITNNKIGNLANLNTSAKTDLVVAINEVATNSGSGTTQVNADWNATSGVAQILNKPTIPNVPDWALSSSKPTYTASEVGALPDTTVIPAAQVNSDWNATSGMAQILNKPSIPNVPSWALESTKPTYTASEVGALPSTYTAPVTSVNGQTGAVNLTIPAAQVQSDWNATSGMGVILNKPTIPAATTITQTLTTGTAIGSVNGTTLYAPTAYDDTALAARVTALEQIPWVTYYTGSSAPNNSQGNNGDLYFQTSQ